MPGAPAYLWPALHETQHVIKDPEKKPVNLFEQIVITGNLKLLLELSFSYRLSDGSRYQQSTIIFFVYFR
jgi:hypothetical protein